MIINCLKKGDKICFIEKCLTTLRRVSPSVYGLEVNLISITQSRLNLFTYKHFCHFYACIQNQIHVIHRHVHVDYNPLKGMLVLISSLNLSIVPNAAGPESWGHSRTAFAIYRCQSASQVSLCVGFLISSISLPTKTTKIGFPRIKVISQYIYHHSPNFKFVFRYSTIFEWSKWENYYIKKKLLKKKTCI